MSVSCVSFRGSNGETTGSPAYTNAARLRSVEQPAPQLPNDSVNFRGYDEYGEKKKSKALPIILGSVAAIGAAIVGMGYAHKYDIIGKMKDGKFKNFLSKANPALEKCHDWCSAVKKFGVNSWEKVKGLFSKKS